MAQNDDHDKTVIGGGLPPMPDPRHPGRLAGDPFARPLPPGAAPPMPGAERTVIGGAPAAPSAAPGWPRAPLPPQPGLPGYPSASPGFGTGLGQGLGQTAANPFQSAGQGFFPDIGAAQPAFVPSAPATPRISLRAALQAATLGRGFSSNPLVAVASNLLILFGRLRSGLVEMEAMPLMEHVAREIDGYDRALIGAGVAPAEAMVAKYLLCGTADDLVQNLPGTDRGLWVQYSMAARFFQTRDTGVGFFSEAEKAMQAPAQYANLLELMLTCLALGFEGQYRTAQNGAVPLARIRAAIFGLPGQMAMLREPVADFLRRVFEPTRYASNAILRGFYLTSGTQEGTPIDQVLGAVARAEGGVSLAPGFLSGKGKSFFLQDLLRKVIFAERDWVSHDRGAVRRDLILRRAAGDEIRRDLIDDPALEAVVPILDDIRMMPTGYGVESKGTVLEGMGLGQLDRLQAAARSSYSDALERMLRPRLILSVEKQLHALTDKGDATGVYRALKVYLLLGGQGGRSEDDTLRSWFAAGWTAAYPGASQTDLRDRLKAHLNAMLDLDDGRALLVDPDSAVVSRARQAIVQLPVADQAYAVIMDGAAASASASPILLLVREVDAETRLTREFDGMEGLTPEILASGAVTDGVKADPIERIEEDFAMWHELLLGETGQRPIDAIIGNMGAIWNNLRLAAADPQQAAAVQADLLNALTQNNSQLPTPLADLVNAAEGDFRKAASDATLETMNRALADKITYFCRDTIKPSFPFSPNSTRYLSIENFSKFFGPGGDMDKYFADYLAPHVERRREGLRWREDSPLAGRLSLATLRQFERAEAIRQAYFSGGGTVPQVEVAAPHVSSHATVKSAILMVNDTRIETIPHQVPKTAIWPGTFKVTAVQLAPAVRGGQNSLGFTGFFWTILEFMNAAVSRAQRGDTTRATLVVGGRDITYDFTINALTNPFTMPELREFECPASLD
ncbi:type IV/VI secretion system ImpK/VasF family protein [Rhodobacter viridis]|uniref:Type IV/VI secretion system ImpK/VasF family protein n=1 Tax=Rhodobacter viridis TaxID=1054202 RepID=A0A318TYI9_9RHOB|nr:type IVB secretion system protein IcmH/DotU [Rhodobacter viridis]PYF09889.1 type IV/VI secretion system ImpK/VasF family protein [Rhodobacter viridis]